MTEPTPAATLEPPTATVDPSVRTDGWAIWVFVLSPLIQMAITIVLTLIALGLVRSGDASAYGIAYAITSDGFSLVSTLVFYVIGVLLVVADWRRLVRIGVPNPLPWQWGFLQMIYLIARGVVLRRRLGRGALVTWIGVAILVFILVVNSTGLFERFLIAVVS